MTTHPSTRHGMQLMPESRAGWSTVALAGLTVVSVVLILLAFALDVVDPADSFTDSWVQTMWGLSIWATGVASVVVGVVATTRRYERSWMVLPATLLGHLPVALLLSEAALGTV